MSEFAPTLLVAKRGPKQYGSTETEVRLLAMDYTLFTPRMLNTVSVRIVDKSKGPPNWENGPAKLGFLARNVDERSDFMLVGSFCIRPIFGESYKCRLEYRAELRPTNYEVPADVLRRAVEESFPFVIASVTKQAVKRDQRRLRSPGFLPQLETPFGASRELAKKADDSLVPSGYLGLSEVNVPTQNSESSQDEETPDATKAAAVRMRPRGETAKASEAPKSWRAIGGGAQGEKWFSSDITPFENPGSLEVHMRRYDTDSLLHRRALAAVRIEAPPALVWDLLTNYENMPKFMPHLMHTEYIQRYNAVEREASETIKRLRLRQVFVKCELFHAIEESTAMDVVQKDDRTELQFRVLQNPKFGALQGKWLVVPTEDSAATVLKFAIEGVVSNAGTDGTAKKVDPLNERIVFEEISTMLKQARDFMEGIASKEVQSYGNVNIKVADLVLKGAGMSVDEEDAVDEQIVGALDSEATDNQDETDTSVEARTHHSRLRREQVHADARTVTRRAPLGRHPANRKPRRFRKGGATSRLVGREDAPAWVLDTANVGVGDQRLHRQHGGSVMFDGTPEGCRLRNRCATPGERISSTRSSVSAAPRKWRRAWVSNSAAATSVRPRARAAAAAIRI